MALVKIVGGELDVPTIEAVLAAEGDDVARFEAFVGGVAEEVAGPSTVDAGDGFRDRHEETVPPVGHTGPMRVVAGTARGRRIEVPDGTHTRPTADRVREAVFNSLYSLNAIEDARVLDLFAGSGALGIEALSRGAAEATFVENDRHALAVLRDNLAVLGFEDDARVVPADGTTYVATPGDYDLVLLDPPYDFDEWEELLAAVHGTVVVIESDREIAVPADWENHRVRRYGGTVVTLATAPDAPETDPS